MKTTEIQPTCIEAVEWIRLYRFDLVRHASDGLPPAINLIIAFAPYILRRIRSDWTCDEASKIRFDLRISIRAVPEKSVGC